MSPSPNVSQMPVEVVVFDLDGVLRHFDRAAEAALEERHCLPRGELIEAAFGDHLGHDLVCGRIGWAEFVERLADRIGAEAAMDFASLQSAVLDPVAMALVAELRAGLVPVALLTNGTHRTEEELAGHGIDEAFDHVFNTARLGVAKPMPEVYELVTARLEVRATAVAFIDDRAANVLAAESHGWRAHRYETVGGMRTWLQELGLPVAPVTSGP